MKTGVISLTKEEHVRLDVINKANAGFITVKEGSYYGVDGWTVIHWCIMLTLKEQAVDMVQKCL